MTPEIESLFSRLMTTNKQVDEALTRVYSVAQEIDKHDGKIMAYLRQKYALPQSLAALSNSIGDNVEAILALFKALEGT